MKCLKPYVTRGGVSVNCGQCIHCRINRTTQWKLRLLYELSQWRSASFVTLTYNTKGLLDLQAKYGTPINSLHKQELQGFIKRLRMNLTRNIRRRIKFYGVGEYGEIGKRNHYHVILFGVDPWSDFDRKCIADSWLPRCEDWHFDRSRGRKCAIQPVTSDDIGYVAGYVQKKLTGDMAREEYQGRQPPFMLCSQGLGLDFAKEHKDRLQKNWTYMDNGKRVGIPRYLREKLGLELNIEELSYSEIQRIKAETDDLFEEFKRQLGKPDEFYNWRNADLIERLWMKWNDSRSYSIASDVLRDFNRRAMARKGVFE